MPTLRIYPGVYRHFKGGIYSVLAVARHSETDEHFVCYEGRDVNDMPTYWVRPLSMFCESVEHNGRTVQRFTRVIP